MLCGVVASIRTRAEIARRLATELKDPKAVQALIEIAEALEADADNLEREPVIQMVKPNNEN
jgi:uncharacterized protein Yka (UPF0111/DUF47 family)